MRGSVGAGDAASAAIIEQMLHHSQAEALVRRRIAEAWEEMNRQLGLERTSRWAAHSLNFGQYVIGGILASSFVQQNLSRNLVGFLGVLVLIASLVKQQFHPDVSSREAGQRRVKLRAAIRDTEDRLAELNHAQAEASQYYALARTVSRNLAAIQASEAGAIRLKSSPAKKSSRQ